MIREIVLFEADLGENMWHFTQEIKSTTVGFIEVNPQAVERNERVVDESPTSFGGDFASATSNIFIQRDCFCREPEDFRHRASRVSCFLSLVLTDRLDKV